MRIQILNPETGRLVYADSSLGKKLLKQGSEYVTNPISGRRIRKDGKTFRNLMNDTEYVFANDKFEKRMNVSSKTLKGVIEHSTIVLGEHERDLQTIKKRYFKLIQTYLSKLVEKESAKIVVTLSMNVYKPILLLNKEEVQPYYPSSSSMQITKNQQNIIPSVIDNIFTELENKIDEYTNSGSGWMVKNILSIGIKKIRFKSKAGSSYFTMASIKKNKALLNIRNEDDYCFLWCYAALKHPTTAPHSERTTHYQRYMPELIEKCKVNKINFPMKISDIDKFENVFGIYVNVFGLENGKRTCIRISEKPHDDNVMDLLYIEDGKNQHFVLIKNFDSFKVGSTIYKQKRIYTCKSCLNYVHVNRDKLLEHYERCLKHESTRVEMPKEGSVVKFTSWQKMLDVPFVIYYDFESSILNDVHVPNSWCMKTVCCIKPEYNKEFTYSNFENSTDVLVEFCKALDSERLRIQGIKGVIQPMNLTAEEVKQFQSAQKCVLCGDNLIKDGVVDKVRDHCHITGKYRGACHNACNLNLRMNRFIPVVGHNAKRYDTHLFIKTLADNLPDGYQIECIPNTEEMYISFSIKPDYSNKFEFGSNNIQESLRFLDSYQFLSSSLDKLADSLSDEQCVYVGEYFKDEKFRVARRKGIYPYEWIDGDVSMKMKQTSLPPIEAFTSKLNSGVIDDEEVENSCSEADYKQALEDWNILGCKTFDEYHDFYLQRDVLLLADIMETFRKVSKRDYGLDPLHYLTLPSFSWDCSLLKIYKSKIIPGIELLTDMDMLLMVEDGTRGGISMIKHRYANVEEDLSSKRFIRYFDANNLYGWAMTQYLPYGGFEWVDENDFDKVLETIMKTDFENFGNEDVGYILDVDIHVPEDKHDYLAEYPLLAEHYVPKRSEMSEYQKSFEEKEEKVGKLCLTLHDKENYVIHYRNLRQAIEYGYVVEKINKVIKYNQAPFLKDYILDNTERRKKAKTDFEKDFYKLMNNSIFGKTMENVRKRINFHLVSSEDEAVKLSSKINYKDHTVFCDSLVGIHMLKNKVVMKKPVFIGQAILDISKVLMYDFHYGFIKKNFFGDGKSFKLLFTDTDSLCYLFECPEDEFHKIFLDNRDKFDTSEYPKEHPMYSSVNKKVIGKMKDEAIKNGVALEIAEFVGLRSKLYSYRVSNESHNRCKGTKRHLVEKLTIEQYKACLESKNPILAKQYIFKSSKHEVTTTEVNKIALSAYDTKNWICDDGIETRPYGHYRNSL
jgi:predicted transcriptional regulator